MPAVTRIAGWKYKEGTTDEQKRVASDGLIRVYDQLKHLVNHGPVAGKNASKMGLEKGLDLAFTVEFKSEEARDEFNPHPLHEALVQEVTPFLEDLFVFDIINGDFGY